MVTEPSDPPETPALAHVRTSTNPALGPKLALTPAGEQFLG